KNTALTLRFSLDEKSKLPAVLAVLGRKGIIEGVDYRGMPVLADVRAVPDSPWYLVSRMDRSEVYAPVRERLWGLVALVSVLLLGAAAGVGMVWRQQGVRHYRERYEAAESLHESESRWRILVDGVKDYAIILLDPGGHVVNWNAGAERMKGYRSDEIIGQHYSRFFTREDQQENKPQRLLAAAESLGRTDEEGWRERKDGSRFWADTVISVLRREDGSLYGFAKITRDLTERRKVEEELQESERKFRTLFETMTEGVALHEVVCDENGKPVDYRILDVNPAYGRQTGLPPERAGCALASELYGTGAPPYLAEYEQVARSGEALVFETYFPPMKKHFRISAVSPKKGQFATVFEDITERIRREEELKRKTAELERFTYTISHDLKSPLVTVKAFLGYLEQDLSRSDAGRIAKDMQYIRAAADKMGQLLDELLVMSRVGRVVHPPVRVTLRELIGEALGMVAGPIAERRVEVLVSDGDPLELIGDRPRLVEIWQNLVENAVKYMGDQASPRIEIGTERRGRDTVFFVRDNGMGIDPRHQAKVFGMFEKLDPASEGTGLGLALVQRIVELHRGTIWLESKGAGQGACFLFTLPDAVAEQAKGVTG
ncbi:MAG: sensor histidine kinase, partial [Candidatus Deferrimicrobiaceae bacterium]